jgi:hypothetical protein
LGIGQTKAALGDMLLVDGVAGEQVRDVLFTTALKPSSDGQDQEVKCRGLHLVQRAQTSGITPELFGQVLGQDDAERHEAQQLCAARCRSARAWHEVIAVDVVCNGACRLLV